MADYADDPLFELPISVRFDGQVFDQWRSVSVSESVDNMVSDLRLEAVFPFSGDALGLSANTVMRVYAGDELVTTVRPDTRTRAVSATSHTIAVQARSLGRELVDCQYSATYSGLALGEIAKRLCETFKVPLQVVGKTELVPEFAMQAEQPANALINAARTANKLLYPTTDGGVILTDPTDAPAVATLVYGQHIQSYRVVDDDKLRYSDYVVRSFDYGADAARKGAAKDDGIQFFRPLHIVGDRMGGSDGASGRRAELERNRRQARANRIEVQVPGWHHLNADGQATLWRINTQLRIVIPPEGIDDVLLVGDMERTFDGQEGRKTKLVLMRREAFVGEPKTKKKRASGTGGTR